jgi:hypothetical protein
MEANSTGWWTKIPHRCWKPDPKIPRKNPSTGKEGLNKRSCARHAHIPIFVTILTPRAQNDPLVFCRKVVPYMRGLFAEVERDLVSLRTKEALAARKASGVKLSRPDGPGRSRLGPFRPEIVALLKSGLPESFVAKRYAVSEPTFCNWLGKNGIGSRLRVERETV